MGVGVDVVEADPGAELGHVGEEVLKLRPHGPVPPEALPVPQVHPVGREVLGHEEELLRPRGHEPRRLGEHVGGVPGAEPSPQLRDDAEAAPVVAPLGELHVGVVPRGELDLGRDEVQKGVPGRGKHHLHRLQNPFHLPRARDGEHLGVALPDLLGARPQAARDHHLAVFLEGLADDLGLSSTASLMKPQVLTMTSSASS